MNPESREAFKNYVSARSAALLRTAYMLTGHKADAEDLLQTALAKTYLAWESIRNRESVDAYVRRIMLNTRTSWWRRRRRVRRSRSGPCRRSAPASPCSPSRSGAGGTATGCPRRAASPSDRGR